MAGEEKTYCHKHQSDSLILCRGGTTEWVRAAPGCREVVWVKLSLLPCDEKAINACLPVHRGFSWTSMLIYEAVAAAT